MYHAVPNSDYIFLSVSYKASHSKLPRILPYRLCGLQWKPGPVLETIFAETNTLVSLVTSTDNRGEISRKKLACIAVIVSQFHRSILINNSCLLKKKGAPPKMVIQVLKREGPTPLRAGDLSADPRPAEVKARPATGQSQPLLAGHSNETRPCCCVNYLHSPKALRPYR